MKFKKVFAKYYHKWYRDCFDSFVYCMEHRRTSEAKKYLDRQEEYFDLIINHWDEIEYFSVGDRAYLKDFAVEEKFRCLD